MCKQIYIKEKQVSRLSIGRSPNASLTACVHSKDLKETFLRTTQVTVSFLYAVVALRALPARLPRTLSLSLPNRRRGREKREEPCFLKQCRAAMLALKTTRGCRRVKFQLTFVIFHNFNFVLNSQQ